MLEQELKVATELCAINKKKTFAPIQVSLAQHRLLVFLLSLKFYIDYYQI